MRWDYKAHNKLRSVLSFPSRLLACIGGVSWTYAHYRNGSYPYQYPDRPRLLWKEMSFWEIIKNEWRSSAQY